MESKMKYLSLLLILFFTVSTYANTFTVTRTDDRNAVCNSGIDCSLREAVKAANAANTDDEINFAPSLTTIRLSSSNTNNIFILNKGKLTINGPGANALIIDGMKELRIFYIIEANVSISGITMQNGNGTTSGNTGGGGAIFVQYGALVLDSVILRSNETTFVGGAVAYTEGGPNRIVNSTLSDNKAIQCGAFSNSNALLVMENSTVSGNSAIGDGSNTSIIGGGFCTYHNEYVSTTMTIRNSTITNNSVMNASDGGGGGINNNQAVMSISNSIIAGNTASESPEIRNTGTIKSTGNNLIGDTAGDSANTYYGNVIYQSSYIRDVNPMLGALQNNGGTTPTHALLFGSPAIDKGNNSFSPSAFDQRGFARIVNGIIDIGAFELETVPCSYSLSPSSQTITASGGAGNFTISTQNGCSFTPISNNDFITIDSVGSGNTVNFFVQANPTNVARTGTITAGGLTFNVSQGAGTKKRRQSLFP
jgi:CSLREA domain-containing protein